MNYEPLPIEVTQNGGHHYHQIWRDEHAAVYEQRNAFGALIGYEAIAIKRQEAGRVFGRQYPAKEIYPCSEDWGKLAISTSDLGRAMDAAREYSKRAAAQSSKKRQKGADTSQIPRGTRATGHGAIPTRVNHKITKPQHIHEPCFEHKFGRAGRIETAVLDDVAPQKVRKAAGRVVCASGRKEPFVGQIPNQNPPASARTKFTQAKPRKGLRRKKTQPPAESMALAG